MSDWDDEVTTRMVEFHIAKTPFEARVVAGVLDDAGVPHFVEGGVLADEFATTQRMMNLQSVAVRVPETHLDAAREALEEARKAGELLGDDSEFGEEPPPLPVREASTNAGHGVLIAAILGWVVAGLLFVVWMDQRAAHAAAPEASQYRVEVEGNQTLWKTRTIGVIRFVQSIDARGLVTSTEMRDREGRPVARSHDEDGDGFPQKYETLDSRGQVTSTALDGDGDGRYERLVEHHGARRTAHYVDEDADGVWERMELREDGEVVGEQRFDPARGWVDVSR